MPNHPDKKNPAGAGGEKKQSMSVYLFSKGKKKCTSAYLLDETKEGLLFLKKRRGGFNFSNFVNHAIQEEAAKWGWEDSGEEPLVHLRNRRGGFNLSNFINTVIQEEARAFGWVPSSTL